MFKIISNKTHNENACIKSVYFDSNMIDSTFGGLYQGHCTIPMISVVIRFFPVVADFDPDGALWFPIKCIFPSPFDVRPESNSYILFLINYMIMSIRDLSHTSY